MSDRTVGIRAPIVNPFTPLRPCDLAWINNIRKQCEAAGVPCFIKQVGSHPENTDGTLRGGGIKDSKGGDPQEWPEALRVRQFPREAVTA